MTTTAYLDHAATTPLRPVAREAMLAALEHPGNASSLHEAGRLARKTVEDARESLAASLGARPSEVVFTSGGTESDNLAVEGTWRARRGADPARTRLVVSAIEHHAVLDCVEHLVKDEGATVTWVEPDRCGLVSPYAVRAAIETDPGSVALVSVMWANNEVGTVAPVAQIAAVAHEFGIPMHSDAVQACGHLGVDFAASGLDLMTVTAHKLGGPVGIGALVARRDATVQALSHGGGQERQLRSGTLNGPGIAAFAAAAREAVEELDIESARLVNLRDNLIQASTRAVGGVRVTGAWEPGDGIRRLPGNAHLLVEGCEGDSLLYLLDAAGVECSTGSACQAGVPQPSHVVLAMGFRQSEARGALRLTLGHTSTQADVDAFVAALPAAVERARRASGVSGR